MATFGKQFSSFVEATCFVGFSNVEFFSLAKVVLSGNIVAGTCCRDDRPASAYLVVFLVVLKFPDVFC